MIILSSHKLNVLFELTILLKIEEEQPSDSVWCTCNENEPNQA